VGFFPRFSCRILYVPSSDSRQRTVLLIGFRSVGVLKVTTSLCWCVGPPQRRKHTSYHYAGTCWIMGVNRCHVRLCCRTLVALIWLRELCLAEPLPAFIRPFTGAGSRILTAVITVITVLYSPLVLPQCFLEWLRGTVEPCRQDRQVVVVVVYVYMIPCRFGMARLPTGYGWRKRPTSMDGSCIILNQKSRIAYQGWRQGLNLLAQREPAVAVLSCACQLLVNPVMSVDEPSSIIKVGTFLHTEQAYVSQ